MIRVRMLLTHGEEEESPLTELHSSSQLAKSLTSDSWLIKCMAQPQQIKVLAE